MLDEISLAAFGDDRVGEPIGQCLLPSFELFRRSFLSNHCKISEPGRFCKQAAKTKRVQYGNHISERGLLRLALCYQTHHALKLSAERLIFSFQPS
jgi:hypothetical protein